MLRIIQNTSAAGAKSYYSTADYYSEGQELVGMWRGDGARRIGLNGEVQKRDWDALCDNRDPRTGATLTARQREPRRVGYDFNFHAPKSLSLLYGVTDDHRLLVAFRESVAETMRDMEAEMQTRIRARGENTDRITGNMIWGEFVHTTARPVDGVPDPHLHAHCFVFNTTWDGVENRWKAGQFMGLKRDAPYFEALFHSRLASRMTELGLPVVRTKAGWEIDGISKATLTRFSRRTALIEQEARKQQITDPHDKSELGAKTREKKAKHLSPGDLRREWVARLADGTEEALAVAAQVGGAPISGHPGAAKAGVDFAIQHCFERNAVVPERQLLREAMRHSVGQAPATDVHVEQASRGLLIAKDEGRTLASTHEVLAEELKMIGWAALGRGTRAPLGGDAWEGHVFKEEKLNQGQRRAVLHVLGSKDRVMLIRGAAGVGKTTMMAEAVRGIEANGHKVFTFAPSTTASRGVLRDEGFAGADTVTQLLRDERIQQSVQGQVIWIDEAGLVGSRTMCQVFDLANKLDARVILSGDRRQHGSVERGSALRLLETEAGLVPAQIRDIQRQRGEYKQLVHALSEGRVEDGFNSLDELGWVREVEDNDRFKTIAADYVQALTAANAGSALIVCPTHREGDKLTAELREQMRQSGLIGKNDRLVPVLRSKELTQAQRAEPASYDAGDVLVFHQNAPGHRNGERITVGAEPLPLDQASRFQAFRQETLGLAPGDLIRITRNGVTTDNRHRLNNGATYMLQRFAANGDMVLANGWRIGKDFGHLTHGYVVTSHASQGRSVDQVFIAQGSESFPASSQEQFYVSVSRGKKRATVYTDDKHALLAAVRRHDDRLTATDLFTARQHLQRAAVRDSMHRPVAKEPRFGQRHTDREHDGRDR